jgi:glycosyltransferase involved in cell wall biosynthesis
MKVLFDISWLGHSYGKSSGSTGLERVIENLACRLIAAPECELTLCAGDSFAALSGSLAVWRSHPELSKAPLPYPKVHAFYQLRLHQLLMKLHEPDRPNLLVRATRKALRTGSNWLRGRDDSLDAKSLSGAEIYHSPFLAIPEAVRRAGKPKCVLNVHDLIPLRFPALAPDGAPAMLRATFGSLTAEDTVLCMSEATKADLCNHLTWLDPKKVNVTYLGASNRFRPSNDPATNLRLRARFRIPNGPYVLSVSSLEPRKGVDHLIRCFARLVTEQNISDLNLVLAGPKGWKDEGIFQMLSEHPHLKDRIIVTGRVEDDDLPALYSGALAFAFPSLYEGFGLPALEAMQCGAPVITSNTSSLPEVVGDAGILIEPRDVDALCQAMLELYRNESRRAELSARGLDRARQFSWERCTRETIAAYEVALSN